MKEIQLTQGYVALVDDEDEERISQHKWRMTRNGRKNYAIRNVTDAATGKQGTVYMHRILMDTQPEQEVDHADHDGLNNRRENLRLCTKAENQYNRRKRSDETSSRFKGVSWDKARAKWQAGIKVDRHNLYLGRFADEVEAARAYDAEARSRFGDFASLNLPEGGQPCLKR